MAVILVVAIIGIAYLVLTPTGGATTDTTKTAKHVSDGSITGSPITQDQNSWPSGDRIWDMCSAIAMAEGYNLGDGAVPYDCNNPGDISDYASTYGAKVVDSTVTIFPTAEIGWTKLREKLQNIVNGASNTYPDSWTWNQVASKWAGNSQAWVNNVTSYLGVDSESTPADWVNGG